MLYNDNMGWTDRDLFSYQEKLDYDAWIKMSSRWQWEGNHTPKGHAYDVSGTCVNKDGQRIPVAVELKERSREYDSYMIEIERLCHIYEELDTLHRKGYHPVPFYVNIIKGQNKAIVFNLLKCKGMRPQKKPKSLNKGYNSVDDNNYAFFIPAVKGTKIEF